MNPKILPLLLLVCALLVACQLTVRFAPDMPRLDEIAATPGALRVAFPDAPATLCREATQLRLRPQIAGPQSAFTDPLTWALTNAGGASLLTGAWNNPAAELYVAFPQGQPLAPGDYTLALYRENTSVGRHTFTIVDATPQLTRLALALTPDGPELAQLGADAPLFYLQYAYAGACTGAPLWITVYQGETLACSANITVDAEAGSGAVACYREAAAPFETGSYRALATLMNDYTRGLTFTVGETPPPVACEPPFIASAITPQGQPFGPGPDFEWYTQAVYAGSRCTGLRPGVAWEARWYARGTLLSATSSSWQGGDSGLVWDSLTGEPFLVPGTYSATLQIADLPATTLDFRVIAYVRPTPAP